MTLLLRSILLTASLASLLGGCTRSFLALAADAGETTTQDAGPCDDRPRLGCPCPTSGEVRCGAAMPGDLYCAGDRWVRSADGPCDARDGGVLGDGLLTPEQAECLGLTAAGCASCHQRAGMWFLRPYGVGGPPAIPTPPARSLAECGVVVACDSALEIVDARPLHFPGVRASVAASSARFHVAHYHTDPSPCDGPCWGAIDLASSGAAETFTPAYWAESFTTPDRDVLARAGGTSSALYVHRARQDAVTARWTRALPRGGASGAWSAGFDIELADVAEDRSGEMLIATYAPDHDADGYHDGLAIERRSADGATRLGDAIVSSTLSGFGVRDVRIVPSALGAAWIVAVQRWDFPPTVQVGRVGGAMESIHGASCGALRFDAADAGDQLAVVHDCAMSDETVLELRGGVELSMPLATPGRGAVASQIAVTAELVVVAYAPDGARAPTLIVLRRIEPGLLSLEDTIALSPGDLVDPVGSIDLAALADGTIAVVWTTLSPDPDPFAGEVAVVRARPCR